MGTTFQTSTTLQIKLLPANCQGPRTLALCLKAQAQIFFVRATIMRKEVHVQIHHAYDIIYIYIYIYIHILQTFMHSIGTAIQTSMQTAANGRLH